jgi:hypothetical protein
MRNPLAHAAMFSAHRCVHSGIWLTLEPFLVLQARLAQLVERKALNLVVVGSSPTVGKSFA